MRYMLDETLRLFQLAPWAARTLPEDVDIDGARHSASHASRAAG